MANITRPAFAMFTHCRPTFTARGERTQKPDSGNKNI